MARGNMFTQSQTVQTKKAVKPVKETSVSKQVIEGDKQLPTASVTDLTPLG
jgi:hypothetical protein